MSSLPFNNIQLFLNHLILLTMLSINAHFQITSSHFPRNAYSSFSALLNQPSVSIYPNPSGIVQHSFLWSYRAEFFIFIISLVTLSEIVNMSASSNLEDSWEKCWNFVHPMYLAQCMCSKICSMNELMNPKGGQQSPNWNSETKFFHPKLITHLRT